MEAFGLIGKTLEHSFSKAYFDAKFHHEKIAECQYRNYPLESIEAFTELCSQHDFKGLNVTIPYKTAIIPYLDELDESAKEVGAVNTILFKNGKKIGYNTDVVGFRLSIGPFLEDYHSKALILGTGGAAKAVAYTLKKLEMQCVFVSRNPVGEDQIPYSALTEKVFKEYLVIVNTTPVGTSPNVSESPLPDTQYLNSNHLVYDLVYNPEETQLMRDAAAKGAIVKNGMEMLGLQAEESWKIWQES